MSRAWSSLSHVPWPETGLAATGATTVVSVSAKTKVWSGLAIMCGEGWRRVNQGEQNSRCSIARTCRAAFVFAHIAMASRALTDTPAFAHMRAGIGTHRCDTLKTDRRSQSDLRR